MSVLLTDVTITREDGSENQVAEFPLNYTYSSAKAQDEDGDWVPAVILEDGEIAEPVHHSAPNKERKWLLVGDIYHDVLNPLFKEKFDFALDDDGTPHVGQVLNFERQTVERRWAQRDGTLGNPLTNSKLLRDDEGRPERTDDGSNRVIYISDSGTEIVYDRESQSFTTLDGEVTDEKPASEVITTTGLFPV